MKYFLYGIIFLCCNNVYAQEIYWQEGCSSRILSQGICDLQSFESEDFDCGMLVDADNIEMCILFNELRSTYQLLQEEYPFVDDETMRNETKYLFNGYITNAYKYAQTSCMLDALNWITKVQPSIYLYCMNERLNFLIDELKEKIEGFG